MSDTEIHIDLETSPWNQQSSAVSNASDLIRRFEAQWQSDQRPRIKDFLVGLEREARVSALRELLVIDYNKRAQAGENPNWTDYLHEIPEAQTVLDQMFATYVSAIAHQDRLSSGTTKRQLDDYEILESIGQGGMGEVFRARQISADRIVAVKVIRSDRLALLSQTDREQFVTRFKTEACAAARLNHPHIVTVYDVGNADGEHYYSMQIIEGDDLAQIVAKGPLEDFVAAKYIFQVASALAAIHDVGMLHRDLKPGNIMINPQTRHALVTDFGLARLDHTDSKLTQIGDFLGSPSYMSPEQVENPTDIDGRADIYSLGATLYHLITGRPPFQAVSLSQTLDQVKRLAPVSPRELNPEIHKDLETICMKCLEKDPARRYATATQFADDLLHFLNDEPIRARPPTPIDRFARWYPKHAATILGAYFLITPFTWVLYILGSQFSNYGDGLHMTSLLFLPWPIAWIFLAYHLIKHGRVFEVINAISLVAFATLPAFLNNEPQQLFLILGITLFGCILQLGVFLSRRRAKRDRSYTVT